MTEKATSGPSNSPSSAVRQPELLAPAGDWEALEAALEAGATAVYFGLTTLNARRRAKNFQQEEFPRAVAAAHDRGARAYLTLNIDLTERELGQAARILELARQAGTDAVLVRDPALLALRPEYPGIEFHFSTQTCVANSADVAAAGQMGASRVVLAREMTLGEIRAASRVPGVATEVFVQGALCFCVSGRCLLSSWVGGRSGNRGACTSPCRVPWTIDQRPAGTPLSMRDLATVHRLDELRATGVAALKIEGRLKNADWVRKAVSLYRRGLNGETIDPSTLLEEAGELGVYTGRAMTSDYLDGRRDNLTGVAGRPGAEAAPSRENEAPEREPIPEAAEFASQSSESAESDELESFEPDLPTYDLDMIVEARGIVCRLRCGAFQTEWSIPKTVVRRAHKAVTIGQFLEWLPTQQIQGFQLGQPATNEPEFLIVPRAVNSLMDRISAALHQAKKTPDDLVRVELPERVRAILAPGRPAKANRRTLGEDPNRARLLPDAVRTFLQNARPEALIVEGLTAGSLAKTLDACSKVPLIAALPAVFFEEDLQGIRALVRACSEARVTVEVNSWGGWRLAREAGVRMEGGPGLPVLNSLAARVLKDAGLESVTLSVEADRKQLEDVTAQCPAPCSLIVFGRPPLMTTRVELREHTLGRQFADRRNVRMVPRRERGLWVFRPVEPFDLRSTTNDRIRAAHLVADLIGSEDPIGDWYDRPESRVFRFNYDRALA